MSSFVQMLNAFRSGRLSQNELFLSVAPLLDHEDPDELIRTLEAEHQAAQVPDTTFHSLMRALRMARDRQARLDPTLSAASLTQQPDIASPALPINSPRLLHGRFYLGKLLKRSATCRVYRAIDLRRHEAGAANPFVAIKILDSSSLRRADTSDLVQRAISKLLELNHPNLPRTFDCDREGRLLFITMEYVDGPSLESVLSASDFRGMDRRSTLPMIDGLGTALELAHRRHLIHGDVRPTNIKLAASGIAKLTGFSVASLATSADDARRTTQLQPLRLYASPETLEGESPDARSDLYSFACIAWELLTGAHPFGNSQATIARDTSMKLPRPRELEQHEYAAFTRALAFERSHRTASVGRFLEELHARPSPLRRAPLLTATLALTIGAAATSAYLSLRPAAISATGTPPALTQHRSQPAVPAAYASFRDCPTCPLMKTLPAGQFIQGASTSDADASELPAHRVTLSRRFAIGVYEVTVAEFAQFVTASNRAVGACRVYDGRWHIEESGPWQNAHAAQTVTHPATCVSWDDATSYAQWLSVLTQRRYRLPSASEWEYAARAGTATPRPWSDDGRACRLANVADQDAAARYPGWTAYACSDGYAQLAPVGSFSANAMGLYDTLGNAFEWTHDCWNDDYRNAPSDGATRSDGDCSQRELRGGSWFSAPALVRLSHRNRFEHDYRSTTVGFRVVREVE
jgi:formylglycine-generating enzyme required for sulfatase activity